MIAPSFAVGDSWPNRVGPFQAVEAWNDLEYQWCRESIGYAMASLSVWLSVVTVATSHTRGSGFESGSRLDSGFHP